MKQRSIASVIAITWLAASGGVMAQSRATNPEAVQTLKDAAQKAVLKNPEVQTRWHAFRAAEAEVDVSRGGLFPRLDVSGGAGRESLKVPGSAENTYTRHGYTLTLNQMVFDGFATMYDVKRLGKAKLTRYFELLDTSETIALEASRAYYDVLRYRLLVELAEDNYVQHRATYEQLLLRAQSGAGRRVDVEQAGSRLALAEVNLTTEMANLHDVTARYQRIVGDLPPRVMFGLPKPASAMPPKVSDAMNKALAGNPSLLAAVENMEASQFELESKRGAFLPKIDLRARQDQTQNYQGVDGLRVNNVLEVVVSYNLFAGGSDIARERQYSERREMALDMREKACRDLRQTLAIAFNDTAKLRDQLAQLDIEVALIEKTRDAYRDQFNIGQRSLLDLLDTQNEMLTAKRSAVNADMDLALAYLRTYASMGTLLDYLGLKRPETNVNPESLTKIPPEELCPNQAPVLAEIDREALSAKVRALMESRQGTLVGGGAVAAPLTTPTAVVVSTVPAPVAGAAAEEPVRQRLQAWVAAWSGRDAKAYLAFYAPAFTPDGGLSREDWVQVRQDRITRAANIKVDIDELKVRIDGAKNATTEFRQTYASDRYRDVSLKVIEWVKVGEQWLILRENSVPARKK